MIHSIVKEELEKTGFPVSFQRHEGTESTYLTFFQYDESASLDANNQEIATEYYYQVNIFSKDDYAELSQQVKDRMRSIGGFRISEIDVRADSDFYQRTIRFKFIKFK